MHDATYSAAYFVMASDGTMGLYEGSTFHSTPYYANQWYHVTLEFDWVAKEVDFRVNGSLIESDIPFRSSNVDALTDVSLFNLDNGSTAWWDGITFYEEEGRHYLSPGSITSEEITPVNLIGWDTLTYAADIPSGTTLTVDVLPATGTAPIPGYENVSTPVNLSDITEPSIRLRANLDTTDTTVTPVLHVWNASWLAGTFVESAWSDAKSSTQALPDLTPPTVVDTTPALSSGAFAAGTGEFAIVFSEAVLGADIASNFKLRGLGTDSLLGTADDPIVSLDISYTGITATLQFTPLPAGIYRLVVRDTITDSSGNQLDGDSDCSAGGDWVRDFVVHDLRFFDSTPSTYDCGGDRPVAIAVGDLNADGKSDIAVANRSDSTLGILLGDGSGGFPTQNVWGSYGSEPTSVAFGEFNSDGNSDLVVTNWWTDHISVMFGDGSGGTSASDRLTYGSNAPCAVVVADFDHDGHDDWAVVDDDEILVGYGQGNGFFVNPPETFSPGGAAPRAIVTADFNGDGNSDIAVSGYYLQTGSPGEVGVLLGDGSGGFSATQTYATGGASSISLAAGDLDGDGKADLVVANTQSDDLSVLLNNGSGIFSTATRYSTGGHEPISVAVADINGDGNNDVVVANAGDFYGPELANLGVLLGNGDGALSLPSTYQYSQFNTYALALGDFNRDGKKDIAVTDPDADSVWILSNSPTRATVSLTSTHGRAFDVSYGGAMAGQLVHSSQNAFDGVNRLVVGGIAYETALQAPLTVDGGHTVVTPTVSLAGLDVHREITIPDSGDEDFARTLEVLYNPSGTPITTTVRIVGNLGSDADTTVWATSDGDAIVEPTDQWIGTDDADATGSPSIIHFIHNDQGLAPISVAVIGDNIEWTYEISVPAGGILRLGYFTILADTRVDAQAAANALVTPFGFGGQAATLLTGHELSSLPNFVFQDLGDAPDTGSGTGPGNYNTLASDNGPTHTILAGLHIGASVDADDGMLQNATANADDTSGTDDEDGLSDPTADLTIAVGSQPTVDVTVTNMTGSTATMFGWIDYDSDGIFDSATERAQAAVAAGTDSGTVTLTFPTVPTAFLGTTYARFRLSTDVAAADATGAASDGEVEDYVVTLVSSYSAEIHGAKWNDLDADGVWDAGEPALADWIIYLDANGNGQVDVGERWARTDADGTYRITDLAAGDYTVAEVVADGWVQSYPSSGAVPGTHQVSLSEGQIVEDVDFGNWQAAEVHGAKWNDLDADGVWDAGELGLAGWTIYLDQNGNGELDAGEPSTETLADDPATTEIDETGMYAFIDLFQGDYIVREVLQEGWDQSSPAGGAYVLTLAPGDILLEQDFGNYQLASISGHMWNDADVDGVWDEGELPLPGQTIYVDLDNDGQWDDPDEPSAVTASDGSYTIGDVKPGEYTIRAVMDSGWFSSLPIVGAGAEFRVNTTAAGDQQRPTIAMAPDGSSVIAWEGFMVDHDEILLQRYGADGTPVGDEVRHTPSTGTPYETPAMAMDTEGNVSIAYRYGVSSYQWIAVGRYWADGTERGGLTATNVRGSYSSPSVAVSRDGKLAAVWQTYSSEVYARIWDADDTTLAGPFQVDGSGTGATVAWGRDDHFIVAWKHGDEIYARIYESDGTPVGDAFRVNTYTSGVQASPSIASDGIGNFVVSWYSQDQDGEGGGIFARLYRADGTPAGEEFQVNTHWEGTQSAPSVSMQPDGHFVIAWQSRYQDGDGYGIYAQAFRPDGAPLGREMQVNTYTLGDQSDPSVTVSMSEEYGLGDFIVTWQSDDQDGDGTGIYARRFSPATPYYALVLDSGEMAQDIDFGSFQGFQPAEIHGAKWNDLDADGVWDAGEPALADWIIYLDANGNGQVDVGERWARTDADGTYRITDLAAGDYTVAEVVADGWVQSYPSSGAVPGTHQVSLSEGQIVEDVDFGNWQAAEVHGAKWNDLDADGVWDAGELGLAGWTIYLDQNGNGELDAGEPSTETLADDPATTEIDETGMYAFIDLFQGDYIVREVLQEGWDQSSPAGGAYVLTLAPGDILLEQDFGNYQLASISGHMWNDADVDGVWDEGELPLPGQTIYVDLDNDGQWDDPDEPSAVTASDGSYTIGDVKPGEYTIRAVMDSGWFSSLPIVGAGAEFRVNTTAAGDQQRPTIAMAPDGSSVIAWEGFMVDHDEILLQRYGADGTPVGDEVRHTPSTGTPYETPAMAMDTEGNVSIAYRYGVSSYQWIAVGRYWADGTERGGLTATNVRGSYSSPSVAVSRDGKLAAVWQTYSSEVYARIWDADDTTLAGPFQVDGSGTGATVAWGRDDHFIVAWKHGDEIYARIYESDGTPVGDAFRVNTYTSGVQASPSIASDGIGNFVVSWYSQDQDGEGGGIFARLYRADGTPAGEEFQVNTHWEGTQSAPSVSMQPDGHFVIAWQSRYQDGDGYGIYAQAFRPDGAPLGREMQVNTYTLGDQSDPSVTVSMSEEYGLGDFIVTWQSDDQDGDGTGIYARRFSPATPYYALVLDSGEMAQDIDFGSFQRVTLSGMLFEDLNSNGAKDEGEPGLADRTIVLDLDSNESVNMTTQTLGDGTYSFSNVGPGTHRLLAVQQTGWMQTTPDPAAITVVSGQDVAGINFGNVENVPPTDISLSLNSLAENQPAGALVGRLTTTDLTVGDSHVYALVNTASYPDNEFFTIDASGNLLTTTSFDYEARPFCSICVQTTDTGGLSFEKSFHIAVRDLNERPVLDFDDYVPIDSHGAGQDSPGGYAVEDGGATLQLTGNHWKKIDYSYTITANTILEFDFWSSVQGEIQGIGFDTDDVVSSETAFQLYGTQTWGLQDHNDYVGPGVKHYVIPVGEFFTGDMSRLVFVNDDDAGDAGVSYFSNVKVYEMDLVVQVQDELQAYALKGYSVQDELTTDSYVGDDSRSLRFVGNAWKKVELSYTVTAATILEFDYQSSTEGEIQGIGFDTDESLSPGTFFQLYGTQTWGLQAYRDYAGSPGAVKHYVISVGEFFTGSMTRLVFGGDDDAAASAENVFSNLRVYEPELNVEVRGTMQPLVVTGYSVQDVQTKGLSTSDDFQSLRFIGNTWKKVELGDAYTVTANTILEFDFQSSDQGEIQGIGFDNDAILSPEWFFQVYGTQTWGLQANRDYASAAGSVKHYVIPIGNFFQGPMSYLILAADDDASAAAEVVFSNLRIYEPKLEVEVQGVVESYLVNGYGDQDVLTRELSFGDPAPGNDGFESLQFEGNTWKKVVLDSTYTVTANTILEFDYRSSVQGEIQGIGFDNDSTISEEWFFQLYGMQTWGLQAYRNYAASAGETMHYAIPVGEFFSGAMSYLIFAGDDDAHALAENWFSNIRLYEGESETPLMASAGLSADQTSLANENTTLESRLAGDQVLPSGQSAVSIDPLLLDSLLSRDSRTSLKSMAARRTLGPWEVEPTEPESSARSAVGVPGDSGNRFPDGELWKWFGPKVQQQMQDRALAELFDSSSHPEQDDDPLPNSGAIGHERLAELLPKWERKR